MKPQTSKTSRLPRPRSSRLWAIALALPLAAPALAAQSPLVLDTPRERIAQRLVDQLGDGRDLPALPAGHVWRVQLDDGGRAAVTTTQGDTPYLRIEARPGELMQLFKDPVRIAQAQFQGILSLGLGQAGFKTRDAVKFARTLFAFPKQIARATVDVEGDPSQPAEGFHVRVRLEPKADTWLRGFVDACNPTGAVIPDVASPSAVMRIDADVDWTKLRPSLEPFVNFMATFGAKEKDAITRRKEALDGYWEALGNAMSMGMDLEGQGMTFVATLDDPDAMRRTYADPRFAEWMEAMQAMAPNMESELELNAFSHRDVDVIRTRVTIDDERMAAANPFMKDGVSESFAGIAGNFLVSTTGEDRAAIKSLIDRALDGELGGSKLPQGTLMRMTMRLAEFLDASTGGMIPTDEVPELLITTVDKAGDALVFDVVAR